MKKRLVLFWLLALPGLLRAQPSVAYHWADVALSATARDTERFRPRPTVTSRYLGLVFTAMFDAWSRYDGRAVPVYAGALKRQPKPSRTPANREAAISYAAYRTLCTYYPADSGLFAAHLRALGYDPANPHRDPNCPAGIGHLAAQAVIDARRHDGANQQGDEPGSDGTPYSDYTHYQPLAPRTDPNRWASKAFSDGRGGTFTPACLTPHWGRVRPVALGRSDQFRPGPPPLVGSEQMRREVREVVELQAALTPEQIALIEFMRDGPQSVQQAGHWLKFAQLVSWRDRHTLDEDVKLFFLTALTAMDAFIAAWDAKRHYDTARPLALVPHYFAPDTLRGWRGENQGFGLLVGIAWRPYSPSTFVCPPFPGYVSGHSAVSAACAEALRLFTGSDAFGHTERLRAGALTEPETATEWVTLRFPTFTQTAELAGWSRVLGGYHLRADNVAGLQLGRDISTQTWQFYQKHVRERRTARNATTH